MKEFAACLDFDTESDGSLYVFRAYNSYTIYSLLYGLKGRWNS